MSRLRRLALCDRYFFVTCKVLPEREGLSEADFALLAGSIQSRRTQHRFLLTAWVFLPDHWHAIVMPPYPSTISSVMESVKVSSTRQINKLRADKGVLWQGRFFDRALRTVKEYHEKVEYIHLNPVKRGLVTKPEEWKWSSIHDYTSTLRQPAAAKSVLPVDRVLLPADEKPGYEVNGIILCAGESLTRPTAQTPKNRRVSEKRNSALPGCSSSATISPSITVSSGIAESAFTIAG